MDKVAALLPVLVDDGRAVVQKSRGEDREHAGVGVRERLARAVHVEQPQRDGRHGVRLAEQQAEELLVVLGQGVDGGERGPLRLGGRDRGEPLAAGAAGLPLAALELVARSLCCRHRLIGALAVDAHAGRDDELAHGVLRERAEEDGCPERVRARILGLLVHALADPDARGQMDHRVHAFERAAHDLVAAHVAGNQLDVVVQVVGPLRVAVHLVDEDVERPDGVALAQELVGHVRADEPGPAGDEHALGHAGRLRARAGCWYACQVTRGVVGCAATQPGLRRRPGRAAAATTPTRAAAAPFGPSRRTRRGRLPAW